MTFGIVLQQAEVDADRVEIEQFAEFAAVDQLANPPDRAIVDEGVIHHQAHAAPIGERRQCFSVRFRRSERLLDQHVLAALDRRLRQREMCIERRRDDHRIHVRSIDHRERVFSSRDPGMPSLGGIPPIGAAIGDRRQANALGFCKISREVGAPIAVADQADVDHARRNSAAASAMYCTCERSRNGCIGSDTTSLDSRSAIGNEPGPSPR